MLYGSSSAYSVGCVVHILFGGVLTMVYSILYTQARTYWVWPARYMV